MLLSSAWRAELSALVSTIAALPFRSTLRELRFDPSAEHPTPVVLVHGLCGDRTNFHVLRDFLATRGVRNTTSFGYAPSIDFQRLAPALGEAIERTCEESGLSQVDVVGHSLGGLLARYLIETGAGQRIRRLVSLGSPHYLDRFARSELAIFAAGDWLIPLPSAAAARSQRIAVVPECSHLSLLQHPAALERVAAYLTSSPRIVALATSRRAA